MRVVAVPQLVALHLSWVPTRAADADTGVMRYIYAPPESPADRRPDFRLAILRNALDRTRDRYGPYVLEPADKPMMSLRRQVDALRNDTGQLTVMYRSTNPDLERELIPVRIPVDRGLTGYRIFLIRDEDRPRFAAVRTLDDLRRFTYGAGHSWLDVDVLRASDFRVVTGSDYEGLFLMLANGRFDALPHGASEIVSEFQDRRQDIPGLAIEPTLVLYYPLPMYFWFPKTPADRAQDGMMAMLADGTYDRLFLAHFGLVLTRLDLAHRRIFRLDSPLTTPATLPGDPRYWFDPTAPLHGTSRPAAHPSFSDSLAPK